MPQKVKKSAKDCRLALPQRSPRNESNPVRFDLDWNDESLFPDKVYPDLDFVLRRMTEAVLESVNPASGELILDIGCGRGIDAVELAKSGAVVTGLEPSPVMIKHAAYYIAENATAMNLVRGIAENLPFRAQSIDKVICKGSLDHFPEPDEVICQISAILRPDGRAVIAIANFGSLGFSLGRLMWRLRKAFGFKVFEARMPWEVPEDHTHRFDYGLLKRLVQKSLKVEKIYGVSLLFGVPWWGMFLAKLPNKMSLLILSALDNVARHFPIFSDVIVLRCKRK